MNILTPAACIFYWSTILYIDEKYIPCPTHIIGQDDYMLLEIKKKYFLLFSLTKEAFIAWLAHLNTILSLLTIDYLESY